MILVLIAAVRKKKTTIHPKFYGLSENLTNLQIESGSGEKGG